MQDESERRSLLGPHVAPEGLYAAIKARPFLGHVQCSHDRLVAGSWHEIVLTYEVGACGIADGATGCPAALAVLIFLAAARGIPASRLLWLPAP
jgi:hypothetical protein